MRAGGGARQRHVDMMVNPAVRDVFRMRAKVTSYIRRSLDSDDFLEVKLYFSFLLRLLVVTSSIIRRR